MLNLFLITIALIGLKLYVNATCFFLKEHKKINKEVE